jgi:hypothetical protein
MNRRRYKFISNVSKNLFFYFLISKIFMQKKFNFKIIQLRHEIIKIVIIIVLKLDPIINLEQDPNHKLRESI